MNTESLDPLGEDWDARNKRGQARQREQSIEAHASEWIRADAIEPILVELAGQVVGILAGITDAARAHGCSESLVGQIEASIRDAQEQIAHALDSVADAAGKDVTATEDELESAAKAAAEVVAGPKTRKAALRKPRGMGKMGRG